MNTTEFHYTTYIKSTPEKVWAAIITPEFAKQYWGNANYSDWKPGSHWEHRNDAGTVMITGLVNESVPPSRLVLTWAAPADRDAPGKTSRVVFAIEETNGVVKLHVTHDLLEVGSEMAKMISGGWPRVLSSLKSYLETGVALGHSCGSAKAS